MDVKATSDGECTSRKRGRPRTVSAEGEKYKHTYGFVVSCDPSTHEAVKEMARLYGMTQSAFVLAAVFEFMDVHERELLKLEEERASLFR